MVSDAWSREIFARELSVLYSAFTKNEPDPLPPLAIQYTDYAVWQKKWLTGSGLAAQADYWRRKLADAPMSLALPTDYPLPSERPFAAAMLPIHLDAELTLKLNKLSQEHGTTMFMTLLTAWAVVLARLSGQEDLVVGTHSANRGRHGTEDLIGFFINTLALRIDLSGQPSAVDLLAQVRSVTLTAQDHQDLPFEQVVEIVQPSRRFEVAPLFQVTFAWWPKYEQSYRLAGLNVESFELADDHATKYYLRLRLCETDGEIYGVLVYAKALFETVTIERHSGYLMKVLTAMVTRPFEPIMRVNLSPHGETEA
jgi:hypothetical protein